MSLVKEWPFAFLQYFGGIVCMLDLSGLDCEQPRFVDLTRLQQQAIRLLCKIHRADTYAEKRRVITACDKMIINYLCSPIIDALCRSKSEDPSEAMIWACKYGGLDVVKWLHELCPGLIEGDDIINLDWFFSIACKGGQLPTAKWMKDRWPDIDHIGTTSWSPFEDAADNGHLHVMKWLNGLGPGIDRQTYCDAFRGAWDNQQFHVLEWLKVTFPDHHTYCDAFRGAWDNQQFHVLEWLKVTFPDHHDRRFFPGWWWYRNQTAVAAWIETVDEP